jgi:hypothetical protein
MSDQSPRPEGTAPSDGQHVVQQVDRQQIRQFVSGIKSVEQQIGEHVVGALQHDDTVAVVTTVVQSIDGSQRIISAGLDPGMLQQVEGMLTQATDQRAEEVPCIGFHCYVKPKDRDEDDTDADSA